MHSKISSLEFSINSSLTMLLHLVAYFCCTSGSHFGYLLYVSFSSLVKWTTETEKVPHQGELCPFPGWKKRVQGGAEGGRKRACANE